LKAILKLVLVALVANAAWRVGSAYASYYRFTDAVQQTTQYRGEKSDDQIHERVFEVRREENHTIVEGSYKKSIQLLPGFKYDWPFTVHVDTFTLPSPKN
jgi:hypothetical protein